MDNLALAYSHVDERSSGRNRLSAYTRLVLVTKYRHKVSDGRHLTRLEKIMRTVCAEFDTELIEFNGEGEHVYLQVNLRL